MWKSSQWRELPWRPNHPHFLRSEIHYATVHFHDPEESYWMPISAVIDVETPRQHWRNIHRFAGYKRFRATIQVEEAEKRP